MGPGVRNYYPRYPVLVTNRSGWVVGVKKFKFRRKRGCTNKSVEYESSKVSINRIFIQKVFQELKNSISKKCWYLVLFYDWMDALAKMKKYFVGSETGQLFVARWPSRIKNYRCEAPSPDSITITRMRTSRSDRLPWLTPPSFLVSSSITNNLGHEVVGSRKNLELTYGIENVTLDRVVRLGCVVLG